MAFYEKVFGWDTHVESDSHEFRYTTLGEGDDAAAGVMDASRFLPAGVPSLWSVYFATTDADADVAKAVSLGATVVEPAVDTPYGRLAGLARRDRGLLQAGRLSLARPRLAGGAGPRQCPGARRRTSWSSQPLPSGSRKAA